MTTPIRELIDDRSPIRELRTGDVVEVDVDGVVVLRDAIGSEVSR